MNHVSLPEDEQISHQGNPPAKGKKNLMERLFTSFFEGTGQGRSALAHFEQAKRRSPMKVPYQLESIFLGSAFVELLLPPHPNMVRPFGLPAFPFQQQEAKVLRERRIRLGRDRMVGQGRSLELKDQKPNSRFLPFA